MTDTGTEEILRDLLNHISEEDFDFITQLEQYDWSEFETDDDELKAVFEIIYPDDEDHDSDSEINHEYVHLKKWFENPNTDIKLIFLIKIVDFEMWKLTLDCEILLNKDFSLLDFECFKYIHKFLWRSYYLDTLFVLYKPFAHTGWLQRKLLEALNPRGYLMLSKMYEFSHIEKGEKRDRIKREFDPKYHDFESVRSILEKQECKIDYCGDIPFRFVVTLNFMDLSSFELFQVKTFLQKWHKEERLVSFFEYIEKKEILEVLKDEILEIVRSNVYKVMSNPVVNIIKTRNMILFDFIQENFEDQDILELFEIIFTDKEECPKDKLDKLVQNYMDKFDSLF